MSGEKVCEARVGAWSAMSLIEQGDAAWSAVRAGAVGAYALPCPPKVGALLIACPPLGAPLPGCGAEAGEACREPVEARAHLYDCGYFATGEETDCDCRDAEPAVDVGTLRDRATVAETKSALMTGVLRHKDRRIAELESELVEAICGKPGEHTAAAVGAEIERLRDIVQMWRIRSIQRVPAWQCSGCHHVLRSSWVGDGTCPICKRVGYLSGSVEIPALAKYDAAALAAMGVP